MVVRPLGFQFSQAFQGVIEFILHIRVCLLQLGEVSCCPEQGSLLCVANRASQSDPDCSFSSRISSNVFSNWGNCGISIADGVL